jgi:hypothetical protein
MRLKKVLLSLLIALVVVEAYAEESYSIKWTKLLGGSNTDVGYSIAIDSSDNIYITGGTKSDLDGNINSGDNDIFITKYSSSGERLWTELLGGSDTDVANSIAIDSSGDIYITGGTDSNLDGHTNSGCHDIFIAKYSSSGDKLWTKLLEASSCDYGYSIVVDSSDNIYMIGYVYTDFDGNTNSGLTDIIIAKYDSSGNSIWSRLLGGANYDGGYSIAVDNSSSNIYISGYAYGTIDGYNVSGERDVVIAKYSSSGDKLWSDLLGGDSMDMGSSLVLDSSDNLYIAGATSSSSFDGNANIGSNDAFITKYSSSGSRVWTKLFGAVNSDVIRGMVVDTSNNLYVTGYSGSTLEGDDIFIAKYSSSGDVSLIKLFGGVSNDHGNSIAVDSKGAIYVTGDSYSSLDGNINSGDADIFLTKLLPTSLECSADMIDIFNNCVDGVELIELCSSNPSSCGFEVVNETYINSLDSGWTLLGSSAEISDMSIFNSVLLVWSYDSDNSSWSLYSSYSLPQSVIDNFNILSSIPANQGFWIYK